MKIYLACEPHADQQKSLTEAGGNNRLISYYYLQGTRMGLIPDIVETGLSDYVERPDEPIDEIPLEIQMIFGKEVESWKIKIK